MVSRLTRFSESLQPSNRFDTGLLGGLTSGIKTFTGLRGGIEDERAAKLAQEAKLTREDKLREEDRLAAIELQGIKNIGQIGEGTGGSTGEFGSEFQKTLQKETAKSLVGKRAEFAEAQAGAEKFKAKKADILKLIDKADTGFGASIGSTLGRATGGLLGASEEELTARTELDSQLKDIVIQGLANFKGAISDKEREFLEKGAGSVTMTGDELRALMDKAEQGFDITAATAKGQAQSIISQFKGDGPQNIGGFTIEEVK